VDEIRCELVDWLSKKGYPTLPSEANMLMVDVRRPAQSFGEAMLKEKIAVGRPWASLPNHVRVTIGTCEEMAKFRAAFARVMSA
jgi:histidinol-phosphate/aromatic aminotransferase/cobyric acid decarboxylase-like protein